MKDVYIITMWSGGRPAKKWKSDEEPQLLAQGTGVSFTSVDTGLSIRIIGSISIEQFESGKEEFESLLSRDTAYPPKELDPPPTDDSNIEPLF